MTVPPPPPPPALPLEGSPEADTAAAPRRRRRWLRRITGFVVLLVALVVAAPFALALKPVRRYIAEKVSKGIGRETTIGGASGTWWGGFELRDVEVRNPAGWQGDPLLSIDRIHVDVNAWKLLTGAIDATVVVDVPVLTLIRSSDGRSNAEGLMPERERESPKSSGGAMPTLSLRVRGGRIVAQEARPTRAAPDVIDAITLDAGTAPDGRKHATLSAVAKGAARGGGDARLAFDAKLAGTGEGPISLTVPPIDLVHFKGLVFAATGLSDLRGAFEAAASLTLDAIGRPSGRMTASLADLHARSGDGRIEIQAAGVEATPANEGDGTAVDVKLAVRALSVRGLSRRDEGLIEPALTLTGRVVRLGNGDLTFGSPTAPLTITGRSVSGTASGSVRDLASRSARADAKLHLGVVLSPTLGRLLGALTSPDDDLRGTASIDAAASGTGGALELTLSGSVKDVTVGGAAGAPAFREPAITFGAAGAWNGDARRLTLSKGSVAAGAMSAIVKPGFVVDAGERAGATGDVVVDADFARLTTLRALEPSLDALRGGKLHAEARLVSGETTRAEWSVRADGLSFAPGALSTSGYVEPLTTMRGSFERSASGTMVLGLAELSSSVVSLAPSKAGLSIRLSDAGPVVESPGTITVRLDALGRAIDRGVGLKPGESLGGVLELTPTGSTTATGSTFEVAIVGRDVRLPGASAAGALSGRIVGRSDRGWLSTTIESATITGYGIAVRATATIGPGPTDGAGVRAATVHVDADLASARPMLGVFLGLAPDAVLAGKLVSDVAVAPSGAVRTLRGTTTITGLHFVSGRDPLRPAAAPTTFDEPSVVARHDLTLGAAGADSVRLDTVTIASSVLSASVGGSLRGSSGSSGRPFAIDLVKAEDTRVVELTATLDADASKVADRLRRFMGEGYEDTSGDGRITGQVLVTGPLANDRRDLKIDGTLTFQRFSSGGLTAESGNLRVVRPSPATPLALTLTTAINRGTVRVAGTCDLGRDEGPWTTRVTIRGLDTSPLLTNKGAGRYLALVMPAIIPAEATSNVLSGLLDADLDLTSLALDQPRLAETLSGSGSVRMTQGSIKDSTIFSSLGGDGAGKGMAALLKLAPGLGGEIRNLSKALMFQSLSSTFRIANRRLDLDPVELISPSVELRFSGSVGFDGSTQLTIPLRLSGDAGRAIEPYLPNRTIPLKVSGKAGALRVAPDLSPESLVKGGLLDKGLEKGKDVLDDLFGGKKKKPK